MGRAGAFRPDAGPPLDIWASTTTVGGVTLREAVPPGIDRDRAATAIRHELEVQAGGLNDAADSLRRLVAAHDPVELICSIAIPTGMGLYGKDDSIDDGAETASWAAKVEYLLGVALSMPRGTGSVPSEVTQQAMELTSDVFDAAQARHMIDTFSRPTSGNVGLDQAIFLLRLEHLIDRMPGYAVHLELIDAEIFDPHGQSYIAALGFNPADVVRVVRRRIAAQTGRANEAMREAKRLARQDPEKAAKARSRFWDELTASRIWLPDDIASDTGIASDQVRAMLAFFSTKFGVQPEFRLPSDNNLARTLPSVDLTDGTYFISDPWSMLSAVHPRLAAVASTAATAGLTRYWKDRQDAHERLTANAARRVFGDALVSERQHYDSPNSGPGEIDVLVALEWPLIIEAKAHTLTDAGRRGAPKRVSRVIDDVVRHGLDQAARAKTFIVDEGGRSFAESQGGRYVERIPASLSGSTEIIVTFERMDPLATHGTTITGRDDTAVWIVALADLLMVADLLVDPGAFHHYARTRAGMTKGPVTSMESDALGSYLVDRILPILEAAQEADTTVMLGYTSGSINDFFTALEVGDGAVRPVTGVPVEVAQALSRAATAGSGVWVRAVDAVMTASPAVWKRWRSFARGRTTGRFALADDVILAVGSEGLEHERPDGLIHLGVRPREAKATRAAPRGR